MILEQNSNPTVTLQSLEKMSLTYLNTRDVLPTFCSPTMMILKDILQSTLKATDLFLSILQQILNIIMEVQNHAHHRLFVPDFPAGLGQSGWQQLLADAAVLNARTIYGKSFPQALTICLEFQTAQEKFNAIEALEIMKSLKMLNFTVKPDIEINEYRALFVKEHEENSEGESDVSASIPPKTRLFTYSQYIMKATVAAEHEKQVYYPVYKESRSRSRLRRSKESSGSRDRYYDSSKNSTRKNRNTRYSRSPSEYRNWRSSKPKPRKSQHENRKQPVRQQIEKPPARVAPLEPVKPKPEYVAPEFNEQTQQNFSQNKFPEKQFKQSQQPKQVRISFFGDINYNINSSINMNFIDQTTIKTSTVNDLDREKEKERAANLFRNKELLNKLLRNKPKNQ